MGGSPWPTLSGGHTAGMSAAAPLSVHLKLLGMAMLWGGAWPAGRLVVQHLPPLTASSWRFAIAFGVLWLWWKQAGRSVAGVPANTRKVHVANLSLGGPGACDAQTQAAIDGAVSRGSTVVVAAGDSGFGRERAFALRGVPGAPPSFHCATVPSAATAASVTSHARASSGMGSNPCSAMSGSVAPSRSHPPAKLVRTRATVVVASIPASSPAIAPAATASTAIAPV